MGDSCCLSSEADHRGGFNECSYVPTTQAFKGVALCQQWHACNTIKLIGAPLHGHLTKVCVIISLENGDSHLFFVSCVILTCDGR